MIIVLGSTSTDKMTILKKALANHLTYDSLEGVSVESEVSDQPLSIEETSLGASHRAINAFKLGEAHLAIGLEGGLVEIDQRFHLVCVAALWDGTTLTLGSSEPLPLPLSVSEGIRQQQQFGELIRAYQLQAPADEQETIAELVSRERSFITALQSALIKISSSR